jgi:hypothetical protein
MTLFDVEELTRYWIDHPPLHLLIAAYLGIGKERSGRAVPPYRPTAVGQTSAADVGQILADLGPGFASGQVHAGMRPVVLDFAELRRQAQRQ